VGTQVEKRQRNPRGEGARLRLEIIEAAMRILDRAPASELSLRTVAREAGVAAPSVYAHFANAEAMMAEIVRECWRQLGEEMSARAQESAGPSAFDTLKAQMSAYVRYAMERRSRYQLLFALQPLDMAAWRELPGPIRPAYRNVLESLERMAAEGFVLPMQDLLPSSLLVLSIAHGRIVLAQTAPHRRGNAPAGVEVFVLAALDSIFKTRS